MSDVKVYKGFLNEEEVALLVSAMDNNIDRFASKSGGMKERSLGFGQDNFPESRNFNSPVSPDEMIPEIAGFIEGYVKRIEEVAKQDSGLDVSLSVLWFIRSQDIYFPDHTDNDGDILYRYDHTCLLYLSDCYESGQLYFPEEGFEYSPRRGDLVSFSPDSLHGVKHMSEPRYTMPSWFTTDKQYALYKNSSDF